MISVCDIRTQKTETRRTRLTAGRNIIDYPVEFRTPISDLTTMKLHVNRLHLKNQINIHVHGRKIFLPKQPYE